MAVKEGRGLVFHYLASNKYYFERLTMYNQKFCGGRYKKYFKFHQPIDSFKIKTRKHGISFFNRLGKLHLIILNKKSNLK